MATIRKRANTDGTITYQVQIRRKGLPPESCSFARLTDAHVDDDLVDPRAAHGVLGGHASIPHDEIAGVSRPTM